MRDLNSMLMFLDIRIFAILSNAVLAIPILLLISLSHFPSSVAMYPRYTILSTCWIGFPSTLILIAEYYWIFSDCAEFFLNLKEAGQSRTPAHEARMFSIYSDYIRWVWDSLTVSRYIDCTARGSIDQRDFRSPHSEAELRKKDSAEYVRVWEK